MAGTDPGERKQTARAQAAARWIKDAPAPP